MSLSAFRPFKFLGRTDAAVSWKHKASITDSDRNVFSGCPVQLPLYFYHGFRGYGGCIRNLPCGSLFFPVSELSRPVQGSLLKGSLKPHYTRTSIRRAWQIGLPASIEQIITGSSYVMFTRIVSSLGSISIAANSFAITAESLCYMPGYGCAAAASVIIGQCSGAGRIDLQKQMAWRICRIGVFMMTLSGVAMFILAPYLMGMLTPVPEIAQLGIQVLRIEALQNRCMEPRLSSLAFSEEKAIPSGQPF